MRILLVDDHPITRAALASLLEGHDFSVAGEAADGDQAIELARRLRPDLVLLDLSMPGLDGLQALPRIREAAPATEVVVLTASGTEENLLAAIRGGAAGYLLKSEPPERIAAFLRGIAEGDLADVLLRAAAFARVVATGRATLSESTPAEAQRMLVLAEQLEAAGHAELGAGLA